MTVRREDQRRALASPLRLEILGLFASDEPLSVAQMAERMGRPPSAIHYHVRQLEKSGILRRVGVNRSGRRPPALYRPAADLFRVAQPKDDTAGAAMRTMAAAFRMAERDMKAALTDPQSRDSGPYRNLLGARIHCRLSRKELAELNRHLHAIETMMSRVQKKHEPGPEDRFVSLTLALAPLRNREAGS